MNQPLYGPYAAIVFTLLAAMTTGLLCITPGQLLRRKLGRAALRLALACLGVRFTVTGQNEVPDSPFMAVANHGSLLDGLILTAALPPSVTFVVHEGARTMPIFGLLIRRMGVTFVRNEQPVLAAVDVRKLIRRAQAGESLAIFPEGDIGDTAGMRPFKTGAFFIAVHAEMVVLPCVIHGSRAMFGRKNGGPQRGPIHVEILPALAPIRGDKRNAQQLALTVAGVIQAVAEPSPAP